MPRGRGPLLYTTMVVTAQRPRLRRAPDGIGTGQSHLRYWKRLGELKTQLMDRPMSRDDLLEKIGAAQDRAGRQAAILVRVALAAAKP